MRKLFRVWVVVALSCAAFFYSCRQDNKVSIAPKGCDTTNVSFATVKPIFASNCIQCHEELDTEADAKAWGDFGALIGAIKHEPNYEEMPQSAAQLSACDIQKIEIWYNKIK